MSEVQEASVDDLLGDVDVQGEQEGLVIDLSSSETCTETSGDDPAEIPLRRSGVTLFPCVPPWRLRLEDEFEYQYYRMFEGARQMLKEIYRNPNTMTPEQIIARLERDNYDGWSLEWERMVTARIWKKRLERSGALQVLKEVLPYGASESLYYLVISMEVKIAKRNKKPDDDTLENGSTVFEISDTNGLVFLRLFQSSKRDRWTGRKVFTGKDRRFRPLFQVEFTRSKVTRRPTAKVYCPVGCHIGTLVSRWSWREKSYYSIVSPRNPTKEIGRIKGRRVKCWLDADFQVSGSIKFYENDVSGEMRGVWAGGAKEPDFSVTFPKHPTGILTKLMTITASVLVFDRRYKRKMRGRELPVTENTPQEDAKVLRRIKKRRRLACVRNTASDIARMVIETDSYFNTNNEPTTSTANL